MNRVFRPTAPPRNLDRKNALRGSTGLVRLALFGSLSVGSAAIAQGLPTGGSVTAGSASISGTASTVTINQSSQSATINWQSFGIAAGNSVTFVQPNASAVALNRVLGPDPSVILGNLFANGKVFLVNPNGVLFGQGAQVNVGGLVASTLDLGDADFMAGHYGFSGTSGASVVNRGTISADGGSVALLGASVSNEGVIQARLGTIALAAGQAVTLDVAGDGLLSVAIDTGAINALVHNGGLIRADGGTVVMTAQAAGQLLHTVVNNSGIVEARTLEGHAGSISLLADMRSGSTTVSGTLDASAPNGGNGGFIETSASSVNIAPTARITTAPLAGQVGTWLIDPQDFVIAPIGGNISGATLSALLVTNSVTITTNTGSDGTVAGTPPVTTLNTAAPGNGDITVNDAISWTAAPSTTTLTLSALRDITVNAPISATNGNVVLCCGRDANVNAAITTVNGSVLASAGNDIRLAAVAAITTTDGNVTLCAGKDILIAGAVTLTRGTTIPAQSLGLATGLTFIAGTSGTGPGVAGGTVIFAPLTPAVTVTGPNAPVVIDYNPVSYTTPSDYSIDFALTGGATLAQHMLVFPNADKVFDGTTNATLTGFNGNVPAGVTLVAGPGATAVFDNPAVSAGTGVTFSGYTLGGPDAAQFALAGGTCCVTTFRTTGAITAAVTPPVVVPPVIVPPPVVTPPVVTPPVVVPPVVTPPVVVPPVVVPPPVVTPPVVVPPVVTPPVVVPPVVVPPPVVTPPVVTPPVVTPPVVTPPVVTPPVVVPPVVTPPVVVPPVITPPVVVPPVVTPPVVVPPVITPPVVVPPLVTPPVATPPVLTPIDTSPGTQIVPDSATLTSENRANATFPAASAGIALATVGAGMRMPVEATVQTIAVGPRPIVPEARTPAPVAPAPAAMPVYLPKQDRH